MRSSKNNKNNFAPTPPMGWNSYDYFDTTVNEAQVREHGEYMARHLKSHGWEYIVVDIQWYAQGAGSQRDKYQYIPFGKVEMDEYSRLLPCLERFPSAAEGKGFKPLADYIHSLGLKFGIHIMRGIPRIAAHEGTAILGCNKTAGQIANAYSICPWNPDMYGVDVTQPEAQLYYDSLMELYAQWGVDLVKCDDICRYDADTAEQEINMLYQAIQHSGRPIVLSLSPGPALVEKAWIYENYANMWRITDDLWDDWNHILNMFHRCEQWQNHVSQGCYPDCDMIPIGKIGKGFGEERDSRLTFEEEKTLMTLWCIFRSPLMLGANLPLLDPDTLSLLTNDKVLGLLSHSRGARQVKRTDQEAVWVSRDTEPGVYYVALFNLEDTERRVSVELTECGDWLEQTRQGGDPAFEQLDAEKLCIQELWSGKQYGGKGKPLSGVLSPEGLIQQVLSSHGAGLYQMRQRI